MGVAATTSTTNRSSQSSAINTAISIVINVIIDQVGQLWLALAILRIYQRKMGVSKSPSKLSNR